MGTMVGRDGSAEADERGRACLAGIALPKKPACRPTKASRRQRSTHRVAKEARSQAHEGRAAPKKHAGASAKEAHVWAPQSPVEPKKPRGAKEARVWAPGGPAVPKKRAGAG